MDRSDSDWAQDLGVLYRRPLEFWPTADQTASERRNALTRLVGYAALLAALSTRSVSWLIYACLLVGVLAVAGAEVLEPRARCTRPTPNNFVMNQARYDRTAACEYDTDGVLAREVVAARTVGLPPGADPTPYYTVAGADSLDPLGDSLNFAFGGWRRPTWKQDPLAARR